MERRRRSRSEITASVEATRLGVTLGRAVAEARRALKLRQTDIAARVGISQSRISEIERGKGEDLPLAKWVRLGVALGRPLAVTLTRPLAGGDLGDAVHLDIQEALLRLVRGRGWVGSFELPTRPADPSHSVDVLARDDRARRLIVLEAWNRFGDLGAAARSTSRKLAEPERLAVAIAPGSSEPYRVHLCWVVRDTAANREIVRRYPVVLRSRFPGSSALWATALTEGGNLPVDPGIVWFDHRDGRLAAVRLRLHSCR